MRFKVALDSRCLFCTRDRLFVFGRRVVWRPPSLTQISLVRGDKAPFLSLSRSQLSLMRSSQYHIRQSLPTGQRRQMEQPAPAANGFAASTRDRAPLSKSAPLDLPALQAASRLVQEQLIRDAQIIPDLGDMLCPSSSTFLSNNTHA